MKVWVLSFYADNVGLVGIYTTEEKTKAGIEKDARKRKLFIDNIKTANHGKNYIYVEGRHFSYEAVEMELDPDDLSDDPH